MVQVQLMETALVRLWRFAGAGGRLVRYASGDRKLFSPTGSALPKRGVRVLLMALRDKSGRSRSGLLSFGCEPTRQHGDFRTNSGRVVLTSSL